MSEPVERRVLINGEWWQEDDEGVWISDGGLDSPDVDDWPAACRELEEARAENDARWEATVRHVRAIFPGHGCITGDCPHMRQADCDQTTDAVIAEALARLARFEALAREAVVAERTEYHTNVRFLQAMGAIVSRLATLATPGEDAKIKRLTHRLATFEALAREARTGLSETRSGLRLDMWGWQITEKLAALATPGEDA